MATVSILLVDDEEADREQMRRTLRDQGYAVLEAGTYHEALRSFELNRDCIGLLISDISLPGGNGCELAIVLRKRKPDLRVLFVSGYVGAEICPYYSLEVSDEHYLRKPFAMDRFLESVRRLAPLEPEETPA